MKVIKKKTEVLYLSNYLVMRIRKFTFISVKHVKFKYFKIIFTLDLGRKTKQ